MYSTLYIKMLHMHIHWTLDGTLIDGTLDIGHSTAKGVTRRGAHTCIYLSEVELYLEVHRSRKFLISVKIALYFRGLEFTNLSNHFVHTKCIRQNISSHATEYSRSLVLQPMLQFIIQ